LERGRVVSRLPSRAEALRDVKRARRHVDHAEALFTVLHGCPPGTTCPVCMNLRHALRALDESIADIAIDNTKAERRAAEREARGNDGNG
jgi:hypothetical protein